MNLTNNAELVLTEIYKRYLEKEDLDLPNANYFEANFLSNCEVFGRPKPNTVYSALIELNKNKFITLYLSRSFSLNTDGIAYMEEKYHKNLNKVKDFIKEAIFRRIA